MSDTSVPVERKCPHAGRRVLFLFITSISMLLLIGSLWMVFLLVPNERTMGPVQRILYFHVGSAIACYCATGAALFCSLWYLATRDHRADAGLEAAGEVGFLFCTMTLTSGMIWGHSAWNTWFRWEPRLVTFLFLWFIFFSFLILRAFGERSKVAGHSAILGLLGAATVPLVVFSVFFSPSVPQLHPKEVIVAGLDHVTYRWTLAVCAFTMVITQFSLLALRMKIALVEHRTVS